MYLRKTDGLRVVTLPDGSVLSRDDLPDPQTRRWVASRKAIVAKAVIHGLIKRTEALARYSLSDEELGDWIRGVERHGLTGLKVTRIDALRSRSQRKDRAFGNTTHASSTSQPHGFALDGEDAGRR